MTASAIGRVSRAPQLRRLLDRYPSADAALAAGNYYVAARRLDSSPEHKAAALTLAGFHIAGDRRFAAIEPASPVGRFAKALAKLFVEGRDAALRQLAEGTSDRGPDARLRDVLADGRVQANLVSGWADWVGKVGPALAKPETHGLEFRVSTISCTDSADFQIDFNTSDFVDLMRAMAADGRHIANIYYDDLEVFPINFNSSPVPNIKILVDYHHSIGRMLEQLRQFDHVIPYGPETHQRLVEMLGRQAPLLMHISDLGSVKTYAASENAPELMLTGALLKDYSPRREGLVDFLVNNVDASRMTLADGLLPVELYAAHMAGCAIVPAMLEEGNAIPVPRFYEALNSGIGVLVDDPAYFAMAFPDHADQFLDAGLTVQQLGAGNRVFARREGPVPRSELSPSDQLLHLALVAPLLFGREAAERDIPTDRRPGEPRLVLETNSSRRALMTNKSGMAAFDRAVRLVRYGGPVLAELDAARFCALSAKAATGFHAQGWTFQFNVAVARHFAGPVATFDALGVTLSAEFEITEACRTLAKSAIGVVERGCQRHPSALILAFERLVLYSQLSPDPKAVRQIAADMRVRRDGLTYDAAEADPGAVGTPLADQLSRAILAGGVRGPADLSRVAAEGIWSLVDVIDARAALADGDPAAAGCLLRAVLARDPHNLPAGDAMTDLWAVDPDAAYGGGGGVLAFHKALATLVEYAPSRILAYGPALVASALAQNDRAAVTPLSRQFANWAGKVIMPPGKVEVLEQRCNLMSALCQGHPVSAPAG